MSVKPESPKAAVAPVFRKSLLLVDMIGDFGWENQNQNPSFTLKPRIWRFDYWFNLITIFQIKEFDPENQRKGFRSVFFKWPH